MELFSKPPSTGTSVARAAMNNAHFQFMCADCTYGQFFIEFALLFAANLLFSAFVALHLASWARNDPKTIGGLGWAFFMVQVATLALSWIYFLVAPVVVSGLVAIYLDWAAWLVNGAKA